MAHKVLIVDDSRIVRKALCKALGMTQCDLLDPLEAGNGKEALEVLAEESVDLVFLDINMPIMNGVEFLERVRSDEQLKTLPVVIVSTEGSHLRLQRLQELGIHAQLRKPFTPELLTETVTNILGESNGQ